jgi:hypothetical protein
MFWEYYNHFYDAFSWRLCCTTNGLSERHATLVQANEKATQKKWKTDINVGQLTYLKEAAKNELCNWPQKETCRGQKGILRCYITNVKVMLRECYSSCSCYESVTRMLQERFRNVTRMLRQCFRNVTRMLRECFSNVTRMLQERFRNVTRMLRERLRNGTIMFHKC